MKLSREGLEHLKDVEGRKLKAYWDRGAYAIGYGHRSSEIRKGERITAEQAESYLAADVGWAEACVNDNVKVPLLQHQFDALVCFAFNIGCTKFRSSTLLRLLNQGRYDAVPGQLRRWRIPSSIIGRRRKTIALWKGSRPTGAAFLLGLSMKKLAVVIGHNKVQHGAIARYAPLKDVSEFEYNSIVAREMERFGREYGLDVKTFIRHAPYPYWKEIDVAYSQADAWGADCSLELHFNADDDPDAAYTITLSSGTRQSLAFSEQLQDAMVRVFRRPRHQDNGITTRTRGRGSRSLVAGKAPAALVEPFFGSSPTDCELAGEVGAEAYGRALLEGAAAYLKVAPRTSLKGSRTIYAQVAQGVGTGGNASAGTSLYVHENPESIEATVSALQGGPLSIIGDAMQTTASLLEPLAAIAPWVMIGSTTLLVGGIVVTTIARISDYRKGKA